MSACNFSWMTGTRYFFSSWASSLCTLDLSMIPVLQVINKNFVTHNLHTFTNHYSLQWIRILCKNIKLYYSCHIALTVAETKIQLRTLLIF